MNQYCILTPTFTGHFNCIKYYLKSFDKYVIDKNFPIYFIISKSENELFNKVLKNFKHLNINVLFFENILSHFGVQETPESLLKTYGKFSFQSLKKFLGMLFLSDKYRYFCVLDSETDWIKQTNMKNMMDEFFKKPFIFYSDINKRKKSSKANLIFGEIINYVLNDKNHYWFVEQFYRYWDVNILKDIFDQYGNLFDMVKKVKSYEDKKYNETYGLFESVLYDQYVFNNLDKYNYTAINVDKLLNKYLGKEFDSYEKDFYTVFHGDCGISEHMMSFINKNNVECFIKMALDNNFNVFRIEETTPINYKYQKKFINTVKPNMLVCSQNHAFGQNKKVWFNIIRRQIHKILHCYWLRGKK